MTTASAVLNIIAENDQLVDEIRDLDARIRGIMYTPKKNRRERHEQMKLQRAAKIARHKKLVEEIKRAVPLAQPA